MEPLSLDVVESRLHTYNENINRRVSDCFATECTISNVRKHRQFFLAMATYLPLTAVHSNVGQ